jgi:POT family proton-dependent oligopeptide transporter
MGVTQEDFLEKATEDPASSQELAISERREATEAEIHDLPHIVDRVPFVAWTAALIGAAERFGYYSTVITWRKYLFETYHFIVLDVC